MTTELDDIKNYFNPNKVDHFSYVYHSLSPTDQDRIQYLIRIAEAAEKLCDDIKFMQYDSCPWISYNELRKLLEGTE